MPEENRKDLAGSDESSQPNPANSEQSKPKSEVQPHPKLDTPRPKDNWDKLDVVLKGIAAPVVVALLGFFGSQYLGEKERIQADARLSLELQSKKEDANIALKKDLVQFVMRELFTGGKKSAEQQLVALEFVVVNFNEALNISPFIRNLRESIEEGPSTKLLSARLDRLTTDVSDRQFALISQSGQSLSSSVSFEDVKRGDYTIINRGAAAPSGRTGNRHSP